MKCNNCPLLSGFTGEEVCNLFGDGWNDRLQYEDKDGTTIGCYVERCYIERYAKKLDEDFTRMVEGMENEIRAKKSGH